MTALLNELSPNELRALIVVLTLLAVVFLAPVKPSRPEYDDATDL